MNVWGEIGTPSFALASHFVALVFSILQAHHAHLKGCGKLLLRRAQLARGQGIPYLGGHKLTSGGLIDRSRMRSTGYSENMVGYGSSGGGGKEGFTGRAAIGYDHGYDGQLFYLGLALDERYIEGFVEGCLERIGEDDPDEEQIFRDLWEDETQREMVLEALKADCEVRAGTPVGL